MNDAIEDGVGESGLTDDLVPRVGRQLAGDECRALAVTILNDFHQIVPLTGGEPIRTPVDEDLEIGLDQGAEQAREAAIVVGKLEVGEQPRHAGVVHGVTVAARLVGQRA